MSAYNIRIRTLDQLSSAACFDQQIGREIKDRNENKIKLCSKWINDAGK